MAWILQISKTFAVETLDEPTYDEKRKGWKVGKDFYQDVERSMEKKVGTLPPPPPPPAPQPEPWEWVIDTSAFLARFPGAVLEDLFAETKSNKAVNSIFEQIRLRPYLDLKSQWMTDAVATFRAGMPSLTGPIAASILDTRPTDAENVIARKLYF